MADKALLPSYRRYELADSLVPALAPDGGTMYPIVALARMGGPKDVSWQTPEGPVEVSFDPDGGRGGAIRVTDGDGNPKTALTWRVRCGCGILDVERGEDDAAFEPAVEAALVASNALRLVEYGLATVNEVPGMAIATARVSPPTLFGHQETHRGWFATFDAETGEGRVRPLVDPPVVLAGYANARACEHAAFFEDTLGRALRPEGVLGIKLLEEEEDAEYLASVLADMLGTSVFAIRRTAEGVTVHSLDETLGPSSETGRAEADKALRQMREGIDPGRLDAEAHARLARRRAGN